MDQANLFDALVGRTPAPAPPAEEATAPPAKEKSKKVSRGKKLRRHPSRAPAEKRVVATRPVRLHYLPEGPIGHIIGDVTEDSGQRMVLVKWEGRSKATRHNPRFLVTVTEGQ